MILNKKQSAASNRFNGNGKAPRFQGEGTASMSDEVWIFVSYAHNDDLQLGDSKDEKGFVTFLHEMLKRS
jgi:hypothetical protein